MKKTRLFFLLLLLVFLINIYFSHCSKGGEKIPLLTGDINYNLLIITVDALRADRIGCYGFEKGETPHINQLARQGIMFKNCFTSVPLSLPSLCTMFTGRVSLSHGVRVNNSILKDREITLAEKYMEKHFQTFAVIASYSQLSKYGLGQGFNFYDDSLTFNEATNSKNREITAGKVYAKFKEGFSKIWSQKFFIWIHFSDLNAPYNPPPEYKEKFQDDLYNGELAYMDHYLGLIMNDLESKQLKDKTLIVLAGSHGEAFGEHQEFGHGLFCYNETIKVPLIFSHPMLFNDHPTGVVNQRVRLLDLMPTLIQLFGMEIPAAVQGMSLARLLFDNNRNTDSQEKPVHYFENLLLNIEMNCAPITGIIMDSFKYIRLPEPELYDINNDPGETRNLYEDQKSLAKKLDDKLNDFILFHSEDDGYRDKFLDFYNKPDPKKCIQYINKLKFVNQNMAEKKLEKAEEILGNLSQKSGFQSIYFFELLSNLYIQKNDINKAIDALDKGIDSFPPSVELKFKLANLLLNTGKENKAKQLCMDLLKINPNYTYALLLLANICQRKGEMDQAADFYKKALRQEPLNALIKSLYVDLLITRGQNAPALKLVDELIKNRILIDDSDNTAIHTRIGFALLKMREFDIAITFLLDIISSGNKTPEVWNQLGKAYLQKGYLPDSLKAFQNALEKDQNNVLTLSNMGTLYLTLFRKKKENRYHAQAIDFYKRAVNYNPEIVSAWNGLAVAYRFAGDRKKAVTYWEKALKINPFFTNTYFNLGITYIEMGEKKKALTYLNSLKEKMYSRLSERERRQLDNLITEASE